MLRQDDGRWDYVFDPALNIFSYVFFCIIFSSVFFGIPFYFRQLFSSWFFNSCWICQLVGNVLSLSWLSEFYFPNLINQNIHLSDGILAFFWRSRSRDGWIRFLAVLSLSRQCCPLLPLMSRKGAVSSDREQSFPDCTLWFSGNRSHEFEPSQARTYVFLYVIVYVCIYERMQERKTRLSLSAFFES